MAAASIALVHYTAPPIVGGVEAVIEAHLKLFSSFGHPVKVLAGRGDGTRYPRGTELCLIPEIDSKHPEVVEVSSQLEQGEMSPQFHSLSNHLEELIRPILKEADNVILHNLFTKHFNLPLTAAVHRLLDEESIGRCIAWCHDFTWTSPNSRSKVRPGFPWDLLRTVRSDTRYVVVSKQRQATLAQLFNCPADEIKVVYNGVDPAVQLGLSEEGRLLVERLGLLDSDLNLLMPVRITKAKHIEFALQVLVTLKKECADPRLVLTGPPDPHDADSMSYYRSLKEMRRELDLDRQMSFVYESGPDGEEGFTIDIETVGDLFRVCDLLLMPSHREGFGMPVLEAGLAGIPVLSTEIPASKEIGGEDVLVIEQSMSPEDVAGMILSWTENSHVHRLRRRVRQSFRWDAIYRRSIKPLLDEPGERS